jgi:hypothetical protein
MNFDAKIDDEEAIISEVFREKANGKGFGAENGAIEAAVLV